MACGQRRSASAMGIADLQPKTRASYDAAATTPRRAAPPTRTGLPRRLGSSRCSTEAKNASMSMWRISRKRRDKELQRFTGLGRGFWPLERRSIMNQAVTDRARGMARRRRARIALFVMAVLAIFL